ncbi:MAG: hypothetical protein WBX15_06690 [Thermoanaerobaculia bacterium]
MSRIRSLRLIARWAPLLFLAINATPLLAVWPIPPYQIYPCDSATVEPPPGNASCYMCSAYEKRAAFQMKRANPTCNPDSSGLCSNFNMWCDSDPTLESAPTYQFVPAADGTLRIRFFASYTFPCNYCQFWDDGFGTTCGWSVWPMRDDSYNIALSLRKNGSPVFTSTQPALFERGLWMPETAAACDGSSATFTVRLINTG